MFVVMVELCLLLITDWENKGCGSTLTTDLLSLLNKQRKNTKYTKKNTEKAQENGRRQ